MELDEADEMISQMEIEIQGMPQSIKSKYQLRAKANKADLTKYKKLAVRHFRSSTLDGKLRIAYTFDLSQHVLSSRLIVNYRKTCTHRLHAKPSCLPKAALPPQMTHTAPTRNCNRNGHAYWLVRSHSPTQPSDWRTAKELLWRLRTSGLISFAI